jgi:hypothetical protein
MSRKIFIQQIGDGKGRGTHGGRGSSERDREENSSCTKGFPAPCPESNEDRIKQSLQRATRRVEPKVEWESEIDEERQE